MRGTFFLRRKNFFLRRGRFFLGRKFFSSQGESLPFGGEFPPLGGGLFPSGRKARPERGAGAGRGQPAGQPPRSPAKPGRRRVKAPGPGGGDAPLYRKREGFLPDNGSITRTFRDAGGFYDNLILPPNSRRLLLFFPFFFWGIKPDFRNKVCCAWLKMIRLCIIIVT
jgi:hypothetical protein